MKDNLEEIKSEVTLDSILDKMFIETPELVKPNLTELPIKYHISATITMECLAVSKDNAINRAKILTRHLFNKFNVISKSIQYKYVVYKLDASKDLNASEFEQLLKDAIVEEDSSKYSTLKPGKVESKHAFTITTHIGTVNFNYNKYTALSKTSTYTLYIEMFPVPDINLGISAIRYQRDNISKLLNEGAYNIEKALNGTIDVYFPNALTINNEVNKVEDGN